MGRASDAPAAGSAGTRAAPKTPASSLPSAGQSHNAAPLPAGSHPQSEPHNEPERKAPHPSSPSPCRFPTKAICCRIFTPALPDYPAASLRDFLSGASIRDVSAGVYEFGTLGEITEEHFDKTFNTDVRGLLFIVQKALPLLSKGSSVILSGSMVSSKGFASCSVYNASKAAVRSFARTWIVDLKGRDIRVNVLSPGYTDTPGLSHFMTEEEKAAVVV